MRSLFLIALPLVAQVPEPPGQPVDLGGRNLHIHCTGSGSPAVILEAGASGFSIDWSLVQPDIAKTNRVCAYDRSRLGWSDPGPAETAVNFVQDLHRLLAAANEKSPYVLVGASMGGIYVRLFQMQYPDEVKGMVLVDPTHEFRMYTTYAGKSVPVASLSAEQYRTVMPKDDVKIPRRRQQTGDPFSRLPDLLLKTRVQLDQRTIDSYLPSVSSEIVARQAEAERATFARLNDARQKTPHSLGGLPLIVLARGLSPDKERIAAYDELAQMSLAVIEAIREVIQLIRSRSN
ncbi:MAG: alpha/beta fold hydrolase [Bryobacteraceae bacterium]